MFAEIQFVIDCTRYFTIRFIFFCDLRFFSIRFTIYCTFNVEINILFFKTQTILIWKHCLLLNKKCPVFSFTLKERPQSKSIYKIQNISNCRVRNNTIKKLSMSLWMCWNFTSSLAVCILYSVSKNYNLQWNLTTDKVTFILTNSTLNLFIIILRLYYLFPITKQAEGWVEKGQLALIKKNRRKPFVIQKCEVNKWILGVNASLGIL